MSFTSIFSSIVFLHKICAASQPSCNFLVFGLWNILLLKRKRKDENSTQSLINIMQSVILNYFIILKFMVVVIYLRLFS